MLRGRGGPGAAAPPGGAEPGAAGPQRGRGSGTASGPAPPRVAWITASQRALPRAPPRLRGTAGEGPGERAPGVQRRER